MKQRMGISGKQNRQTPKAETEDSESIKIHNPLSRFISKGN